MFFGPKFFNFKFSNEEFCIPVIPKKKRATKLLEVPEQGKDRKFHSLPPSKGRNAVKSPPAAIVIEPTTGGTLPACKRGNFRKKFGKNLTLKVD